MQLCLLVILCHRALPTAETFIYPNSRQRNALIPCSRSLDCNVGAPLIRPSIARLHDKKPTKYESTPLKQISRATKAGLDFGIVPLIVGLLDPGRVSHLETCLHDDNLRRAGITLCTAIKTTRAIDWLALSLARVHYRYHRVESGRLDHPRKIQHNAKERDEQPVSQAQDITDRASDQSINQFIFLGVFLTTVFKYMCLYFLAEWPQNLLIRCTTRQPGNSRIF